MQAGDLRLDRYAEDCITVLQRESQGNRVYTRLARLQ